MSKVSSQVGFEVPQYISHVHRVVTSYCIQLSLSNISPLGGTYWITKLWVKVCTSICSMQSSSFLLATKVSTPKPFFLRQPWKTGRFFVFNGWFGFRIPQVPRWQQVLVIVAIIAGAPRQEFNSRNVQSRATAAAAATNNNGETPKHQNKGEDEQLKSETVTTSIQQVLWFEHLHDDEKVRRARQRHRKQEL